jgi:hypothetical protein
MHTEPGCVPYTFELASEFTQAIRVCRPNEVAKLPDINGYMTGIAVDPEDGEIAGVMIALLDDANERVHQSGPWTVAPGLTEDIHVKCVRESVYAPFN